MRRAKRVLSFHANYVRKVGRLKNAVLAGATFAVEAPYELIEQVFVYVQRRGFPRFTLPEDL